MMKKAKRINLRLSAAVFLLILGIFGGCSRPPKIPADTTTGEPDTVPSPEDDRLFLTDDGAAICCVLFPDGGTEESKLARKLCTEMAEKTDGTVSFRAYSSNSLSSAEEYRYMITVGEIPGITSPLYSVLRTQDYAVIRNGKYLSVLGRSYDMLYLGKEMLCKSISQSGGELYVQEESLGTVRYGQYDIEELQLGGSSIRDYTIVTSEQSAWQGEQLQSLIAKLCGYVLPVVADDTPAGEMELVIGVTSRSREELLPAGSYCIRQDGKRLLFLFDGTATTWEQMMAEVQKKLADVPKGGAYQMEQLSVAHSIGETVKVMTYNVQNVWNANGQAGNRDDITANLILSESPDFVCLQEFDVWYRNSENGLSSLLSDRYAEVLPQGVDPDNIWNPVFYRKDAYRVVESGYLKFLDSVRCTEYTHYVGTSDGQTKFRTMVWAVLESTSDGKLYLVGSLHYSLISSGESSDSPNAVYNVRDQLEESNLVIETIAELNTKYHCTVLLCGDYNSTQSRAGGGALLMLENGFLDTYNLAEQKNDYATTHDSGSMPQTGYRALAIDHIFTLSALNVKTYFILTDSDLLRNSDHLPSVMQFAVQDAQS